MPTLIIHRTIIRTIGSKNKKINQKKLEKSPNLHNEDSH
jgi:hypothetical protein